MESEVESLFLSLIAVNMLVIYVLWKIRFWADWLMNVCTWGIPTTWLGSCAWIIYVGFTTERAASPPNWHFITAAIYLAVMMILVVFSYWSEKGYYKRLEKKYGSAAT